MAVPLTPLPYLPEALEPHISRRTVELHHGAHHKGYVDQTNEAIEDTDLAEAELNEIVLAALGKEKLFNSASQAWNHGFYWHSLSAGTTSPSDRLRAAIERDFGSIDGLRKKLIEEATGHFASGWAWLVATGDALEVISTQDARSPLSEDAGNPLLTIDVWEHAYYLDAQNKRPAYVSAVVDNLLDWRFASENYERGSVWRYPSDADARRALDFAAN